MVLVLAGLPAFLFSMRDYTVSWIRLHQGQVIEVEATFAKPAGQTWPARRRPIPFPGKSSHVLKQVLAELSGGVIENPLKP